MATSIEPALFKQVMGRFASGVTVITVKSDSYLHGMTASAFSSLSLDPPLVIVCIGKRQKTHELVWRARRFAVNILGAGQEEVSEYFARPRPDGEAQFDRVPTRPSPGGQAFIEGCLAYIDCRLSGVLPGGDHDVFVGHVEHMEFDAVRDQPLVYYRGNYCQIRH